MDILKLPERYNLSSSGYRKKLSTLAEGVTRQALKIENATKDLEADILSAKLKHKTPQYKAAANAVLNAAPLHLETLKECARALSRVSSTLQAVELYRYDVDLMRVYLSSPFMYLGEWRAGAAGGVVGEGADDTPTLRPIEDEPTAYDDLI